MTWSLRGVLQSAGWLPDTVKPPRRQNPSPAIPMSYLERTQIWVSKRPATTAAIIAFIGTGMFVVWRQRRHRQRKRRARRTASGARTEVIVLAGSPHSPFTHSLSLDLERRGFIVYIPVGTLSEEQLVQSESRSDIRPLHLDITSVRPPYEHERSCIDPQIRLRQSKKLLRNSPSTSSRLSTLARMLYLIPSISHHSFCYHHLHLRT